MQQEDYYKDLYDGSLVGIAKKSMPISHYSMYTYITTSGEHTYTVYKIHHTSMLSHLDLILVTLHFIEVLLINWWLSLNYT